MKRTRLRIYSRLLMKPVFGDQQAHAYRVAGRLLLARPWQQAIKMEWGWIPAYMKIPSGRVGEFT